MATLHLPTKSVAPSLSTLKLTTATKPTSLSAVQMRRNKLSNQLWQQLQLASAKNKGETYAPLRTRTVTNKDTGERHTIEQAKRIKQWWFTDAEGVLCLQVRYGAKVIELSKGKNAIELASNEEFIPTLNLIKQAVEGGELDKELEAKSASLKCRY